VSKTEKTQHKAGNRFWVVMAIAILILMTAGYMLGSSTANPVAGEDPGQNSDGQSAPGDPPANDDSDNDDDIPPTITAGQELLVPVPETDAGQPSTVIDRADPSCQGRVALTFDSGWIFEPVPDLLQVLRENGVRATFFLRGGFVADHPDLVKQIAAEGHLLGNHSYTHGHMTTQTAAQQQQELADTNELIYDLTGQRPFLFRPPYGEYNGDLLRSATAEGFPYTVMWTVDSLDWQEPGVEAIYERVSAGLVDGAIILMHVGSTQTPQVLPRLIALIREQGYELVTVAEMLPEEAFTGQRTYVVQEGDTLTSIARKYGTSVEKLIALNELS